jgi:hypothetical protein
MREEPEAVDEEAHESMWMDRGSRRWCCRPAPSSGLPAALLADRAGPSLSMSVGDRLLALAGRRGRRRWWQAGAGR